MVIRMNNHLESENSFSELSIQRLNRILIRLHNHPNKNENNIKNLILKMIQVLDSFYKDNTNKIDPVDIIKAYENVLCEEFFVQQYLESNLSLNEFIFETFCDSESLSQEDRLRIEWLHQIEEK